MMAQDSVSRLSKKRLNQLFIDALGSAVCHIDDLSGNPLIIDLCRPYPIKLRVYIFNCTNPPGGRALGEYKIQPMIKGQQNGQKCHFDYSDTRIPLCVGYAQIFGTVDDGVFVLWDTIKHEEFSFSANFQVKMHVITDALDKPIASGRKNNGEIILAARSEHLLEAIEKRMDIMLEMDV